MRDKLDRLQRKPSVRENLQQIKRRYKSLKQLMSIQPTEVETKKKSDAKTSDQTS